MPSESKILLQFEGQELARSLDADQKKTASVQLSLTLPANYRREMQIFVTLDKDLKLVAGSVKAIENTSKVTPLSSFLGKALKSLPFKFIDVVADQTKETALLAVVPKSLPGEEDSSNDAVLTWEMQVTGLLSATFSGHQIQAWAVLADDNFEHASPLTFQLLPPAPAITAGQIQLADMNNQPNVFLEPASTAPVHLHGGGATSAETALYWVRKPEDVALKGRVSTELKILYAEVTVDRKQSIHRAVLSGDGTQFNLDSVLKGLKQEDLLKEIQLRFSQTEEPEKNFNPHGWTSPVKLRVKIHSVPPSVNGTLTQLAQSDDYLTLQISASDANGPGLEKVETKIPAIRSNWDEVTLQETGYNKEFHLSDSAQHSARVYDFSKGIYIRATDKIGNFHEVQALIDSSVVVLSSTHGDIRYNHKTDLMLFLSSISTFVVLPPALIAFIWPEEWSFENTVRSTPGNLMDDTVTTKILMSDPNKVGKGIPLIKAALSGDYYKGVEITEMRSLEGKYLPERPDFKLDPVQPVFHSGKIVINGVFIAVPVSSHLVFEYSKDGGITYATLDSVDHTEGQLRFSVTLPDVFNGNGKNTVLLRISHEGDVASDRYATSDKIEFIVNDAEPVFSGSSVKLSVSEDRTVFQARAMVKNPAASQNPVTHVGVNWVGAQQPDNWVLLAQALDPAVTNQVADQPRILLQSPRNAIKGTLAPHVFIKSLSGEQQLHPAIFDTPYGLVDISGTIKKSNNPINNPIVSRQDAIVKLTASLNHAEVLAGDVDLIIEAKLTFQVGLKRVNVNANIGRVGFTVNPKEKAKLNVSGGNIAHQAQEIARVQGWNGNRQVLSLDDPAAGVVCSLTFPVRIPKRSPAGDYLLTLTIRDLDSPPTAFGEGGSLTASVTVK